MIAGAISGGVMSLVAVCLGVIAGGPAGVVIVVLGVPLGLVFGWFAWQADSYDLRSPRGLLAFVVDHTWSLPNTYVGAGFLGVNLLLRNSISIEYSRGHNCVHLTNGVFPGYLTTIGPVIAGVAPSVHPHEHGHIMQARLFGPLYFPLIAVHYAIVVVLPYWLIYHDRKAYPVRLLRSYFLNGVYPHVWHEAWCYRRYGPERAKSVDPPTETAERA